jgi:hypothetical protein
MKVSILFYSILLMLAGCSTKKDNIGPNDLPPETHTGANTFGCLINGKGFLPQGAIFTSNPHPYFLVGGNGRNGASITAEDQNHTPGFFFRLNIDSSSFRVGTYPLPAFNFDSTFKVSNMGFDFNYGLGNYTFNPTGQLVITFIDHTNHIISGTFSFDAYDPKGVKYEVRSGRFDLQVSKYIL